MARTTYTAEIGEREVGRLRAVLERSGFEFVEKPYAHYAARKGKLNVTVYEKGPKVLVQGRETEDFVKFVLEPEVLGEARLGYEAVHQPEMFEPHFGIDESGKGDFFGPLVIAGVGVREESARGLMEAGVTDSKRIGSAARVRELAAVIRQTVAERRAVVTIGPARYNQLYQSFGNLNELLAWGHAKVIEELATADPECPRALSDQFANPRVLRRQLAKRGLGIALEQRPRAESDVAVAAASILARERFIEWIRRASEQWEVGFPLGAGPPVLAAGRRFLELHGAGNLSEVAKMHFRTAGRLSGDPE